MNLYTATLTTMALLASAPAQAQTLVITRGGSRPAQPAPTENFTGGARVETLFDAVDPSHASGGSVTFEPGARTAWHSHPRGQILIVTAGIGRVQRWGDSIEEIRQGDVVRIPAGAKHWHSASPQASMTHIAITEHRDGARVQWMEKVSDEQYNAAVRSEQPQSSSQQQRATGPSGALQQKIAPGLATLTDEVLFGDVWRRPELSPRDRSLVTISVLIATGKPAQLALWHLNESVSRRTASGSLSPWLESWCDACTRRLRSRLLGEGSFVLTASEGTLGGRHVAFYDLSRVEDGKIGVALGHDRSDFTARGVEERQRDLMWKRVRSRQGGRAERASFQRRVYAQDSPVSDAWRIGHLGSGHFRRVLTTDAEHEHRGRDRGERTRGD